MKKSSGVPPSMTTTQVSSTSTPNSDIEKDWTLVEKRKKSSKVCTKVSCATKCAQEVEVRDHLYQNINKPTYQQPRVAPTDDEIIGTVQKHFIQMCKFYELSIASTNQNNDLIGNMPRGSFNDTGNGFYECVDKKALARLFRMLKCNGDDHFKQIPELSQYAYIDGLHRKSNVPNPKLLTLKELGLDEFAPIMDFLKNLKGERDPTIGEYYLWALCVNNGRKTAELTFGRGENERRSKFVGVCTCCCKDSEGSTVPFGAVETCHSIAFFTWTWMSRTHIQSEW